MKHSDKFLYLSDVLKSRSTSSNFARMAAISLGFGLALSACSDNDKTAGGGPSGSEAGNAIMAQILTADAKPAANAKVKLIDSESLDSENAYTATADEDGVVSIEGVAAGSYTLEAKLKGEALQMPAEISTGDEDLGCATLQEMASLKGSVGSETAKGTVKVRGLDYEADVVDGAFALDSLPAGPINLVFISTDSDTVSSYVNVKSGEEATGFTFASEKTSLLLEDFEDGDHQHRFMPLNTYDGGWWFFDYENRNVVPNYVLDEGHFFLIDKVDGSMVGHVSAEFNDVIVVDDTTKIYPWATIGLEIGSSDETVCNDLSSVDSIAFRIKGTGALKFALVDKNISSTDQTIGEKIRLEIPEDWERAVVAIDDLAEDKSALKCVTLLTWAFEFPGGDLLFDDIELIGGDKNSIWAK